MTASGAVTSVALNSSWLDSGTVTGGDVPVYGNANSGTATLSTGYWWPYPSQTCYPWYVPCYHPEAKPIKLAMSEVAKLRAAAQKDKGLKAILAKFTDLIEVTVDFE